MKKILLCLIFSISIQANELLALNDVSYKFDPIKMSVANNSFMFLRSFVDYYYLLIKENKTKLPFVINNYDNIGFCAGDAHPENFGVLINENKEQVFTINDWDDSDTCPIVLDIFRLMIASKLYNPNIDIKDIFNAYQAGADKKIEKTPKWLEKMLQDSEARGSIPSPKKVVDGKIKRNTGMNEVGQETRNLIEQKIGFTILDIVETSKVGGGSGGLKRYEVLINDNNNLVHLELKKEINPSVDVLNEFDVKANRERLENALSVFVGNGRSKYYTVVEIKNEEFLVRPRFYGNVGVSLSDNLDLKLSDLINYEASVLGSIHGKKIKFDDLKEISNEVDLFVNFYQKKYDQLKTSP